MQGQTKKLGEMLVEAGLLKPGQLQDALTHQRVAGGRMGGILVGLGLISEEVLMDFLAQKTGVPRLDLKALDVEPSVLQRIPARLADQMTILPIALKEPKSLMLAMADPSDLNAIDSARFASGLNIEPLVASHSVLRQAIAEQYRKLDGPAPITIDVGSGVAGEGGLPVDLELSPLQSLDIRAPYHATVPSQPAAKAYPKDPFFDITFLENGQELPPLGMDSPELLEASDPFSQRPVPEAPLIIHARSAAAQQSRRLESFQTRTLVLGLIRLLQRRGVVGDDELQRFIVNLLEAGELREEEGPTRGAEI